VVSEFKYLVSLVTYDKYCGKDVQQRIRGGNLSYQALSEITKARYMSKYAKLKRCTPVIKSVVLYDCKTWAVTQQMK
jgi:hypothetical protein